LRPIKTINDVSIKFIFSNIALIRFQRFFDFFRRSSSKDLFFHFFVEFNRRKWFVNSLKSHSPSGNKVQQTFSIFIFVLFNELTGVLFKAKSFSDSCFWFRFLIRDSCFWFRFLIRDFSFRSGHFMVMCELYFLDFT